MPSHHACSSSALSLYFHSLPFLPSFFFLSLSLSFLSFVTVSSSVLCLCPLVTTFIVFVFSSSFVVSIGLTPLRCFSLSLFGLSLSLFVCVCVSLSNDLHRVRLQFCFFLLHFFLWCAILSLLVVCFVHENAKDNDCVCTRKERDRVSLSSLCFFLLHCLCLCLRLSRASKCQGQWFCIQKERGTSHRCRQRPAFAAPAPSLHLSLSPFLSSVCLCFWEQSHPLLPCLCLSLSSFSFSFFLLFLLVSLQEQSSPAMMKDFHSFTTLILWSLVADVVAALAAFLTWLTCYFSSSGKDWWMKNKQKLPLPLLSCVLHHHSSLSAFVSSWGTIRNRLNHHTLTSTDWLTVLTSGFPVSFRLCLIHFLFLSFFLPSVFWFAPLPVSFRAVAFHLSVYCMWWIDGFTVFFSLCFSLYCAEHYPDCSFVCVNCFSQQTHYMVLISTLVQHPQHRHD